MASLLLDAPGAYLNIGTATAWRRRMHRSEVSIWVRTKFRRRCSLASLCCPTHEEFALEINTAHQDDDSVAGSGVTATWQDTSGHRVEAYVEVPPISDDQWHLITVRLDAKPTARSARYAEGDTETTGTSFASRRNRSIASAASSMRTQDSSQQQPQSPCPDSSDEDTDASGEGREEKAPDLVAAPNLRASASSTIRRSRHSTPQMQALPSWTPVDHGTLPPLDVLIDAPTVTFIIDGTTLTTSYRVRQPLGDFCTSFADRVVYPSYDLLGARNLNGELGGFFIGRLSDVAVKVGPGYRRTLHWWVFDSPRGRTVWDKAQMVRTSRERQRSTVRLPGAEVSSTTPRRSRSNPMGSSTATPIGATRVERGRAGPTKTRAAEEDATPLHLHACNASWDTEDAPTPSLYVNGAEGFVAAIPFLTAAKLEQLLLGDEHYRAALKEQEHEFDSSDAESLASDGPDGMVLSHMDSMPTTPSPVQAHLTPLALKPPGRSRASSNIGGKPSLKPGTAGGGGKGGAGGGGDGFVLPVIPPSPDDRPMLPSLMLTSPSNKNSRHPSIDVTADRQSSSLLQVSSPFSGNRGGNVSTSAFPSLSPSHRNPNALDSGAPAADGTPPQIVKFAMWINTRQRAPGVLLSVPLPHGSAHVVTNVLGRECVALVYGTSVMVVNVNVCNEEWHEITFTVDFKEGASIVVDGALASWEEESLPYDPDSDDPIPDEIALAQSQSGAWNSGGASMLETSGRGGADADSMPSLITFAVPPVAAVQGPGPAISPPTFTGGFGESVHGAPASISPNASGAGWSTTLDPRRRDRELVEMLRQAFDPSGSLLNGRLAQLKQWVEKNHQKGVPMGDEANANEKLRRLFRSKRHVVVGANFTGLFRELTLQVGSTELEYVFLSGTGRQVSPYMARSSLPRKELVQDATPAYLTSAYRVAADSEASKHFETMMMNSASVLQGMSLRPGANVSMDTSMAMSPSIRAGTMPSAFAASVMGRSTRFAAAAAKGRDGAMNLPEVPTPYTASEETVAASVNPHKTAAACLKLCAQLDIVGRTAVWPKTKLPLATCRFREGQAATLQGVPVNLSSPLELAVLVRLQSPAPGMPKGYGSLIHASGVFRLNAVPGRIVLLAMSTGSAGTDEIDRLSMSASGMSAPRSPSVGNPGGGLSRTASMSSVTGSEGGQQHGVVVKLVAATTLLDDGKWHQVRITIPSFGSVDRTSYPRLLIDENPVELLRETHRSGGGRSRRRSSGPMPMSAMAQDARRMSLPTTIQIFKGGSPVGPGASLDLDLGATPTSASALAAGSFNLGAGIDLALSPHGGGPMAGAPPAAAASGASFNHAENEGDTLLRADFEALRTKLNAVSDASVWRKRTIVTTYVTLGGKKFCGSFAHCRALCDGFKTMEWPLTEGSGKRLSRQPMALVTAATAAEGDSPRSARSSPHSDSLSASHGPGSRAEVPFQPVSPANEDHSSTPSRTPGSMSMSMTGGVARRGAPPGAVSELTVANPLWRPTHLPPMGLKLDGRRTYVEAMELQNAFGPAVLGSFRLSFWYLDSGQGSTAPACLATMHGKQYPNLDASAGVFVHTRINTATSPKTRSAQPFTTSFILCDSSERFLVLETEFDLFDGMWHKVEWHVRDAAKNEAVVIVDDREIPARRPCLENPSTFASNDFTLNVGARDEGASGIHMFAAGEVRSVVVATEEEDLLVWDLSEGRSNICRDVQDRVVGRIHAPQWELSSFPPLTPFFDYLSALEVTPVADVANALNDSEGVRISLSLKTDSDDVGTLFSFLDNERRPVIAMVVNEAHTRRRKTREPGTHRLCLTINVDESVQRTVELQLVANDLCDGLWHELDIRIPSNATDFKDAATSKIALDRTRSISLYIDQVQRPLLAVFTSQIRREAQAPKHAETFIRGNRGGGGGGVSGNATPNVGSPRDYSARTLTATASASSPPPDLGLEASAQATEDDDDDSETESPTLAQTRTGSTANFSSGTLAVPGSIVGALRRSGSYESPAVGSLTVTRSFEFAALVIGRATDADGASGMVKNCAISRLGQHGTILLLPLTETASCISDEHRDVAVTNLSWRLTVPPPSCVAVAPGKFITFGTVASLDFARWHFRVDLKLPREDEWEMAPPMPQCIVRYGGSGGNATELKIMLHDDSDGVARRGRLSVFLTDDDDAVFQFYADATRAFDGEWHTIDVFVNDALMNEGGLHVDGHELQLCYGECGGPSQFSHDNCTGTLGAVCLDGLAGYAVLEAWMMAVSFTDIGPDPTVHARWDMRTGYGNVLRDTSGNRRHAMARNPLWRTMIVGETVGQVTQRVGVVKSKPRSMATEPPGPGFDGTALGGRRRGSTAAEWRRDTATFLQLDKGSRRRESIAQLASRRRSQHGGTPQAGPAPSGGPAVTFLPLDDFDGAIDAEAIERETASVMSVDDGGGYIPREARDLVTDSTTYVTRWGNNPSDESYFHAKSGMYKMHEWPEVGWQSCAPPGSIQALFAELHRPSTIFLVAMVLPRAVPATIDIIFSRGLVSDRTPEANSRGGVVHDSGTVVRRLEMSKSTNRLVVVRFPEPYSYVRSVGVRFLYSERPAAIEYMQVLGVPANFDIRRKHSLMPVETVAPQISPSPATLSLATPSAASAGVDMNDPGSALLDAISLNSGTQRPPAASSGDDSPLAVPKNRGAAARSGYRQPKSVVEEKGLVTRPKGRFGQLTDEQVTGLFNQIDAERRGFIHRDEAIDRVFETLPPELVTRRDLERQLVASGAPPSRTMLDRDRFQIFVARLSRL